MLSIIRERVIIAVLLHFAANCLFVPSQAQTKTPKAVFILIDGVPADVVEKLDLPCLKEIAKAGGFTRAHVGGNKGTYNETPTISAPGYMDLITGTWGNKHNVWDNKVAAPNYNYKNIFRIVKESSPELKTGLFSTWEDNRTKLIGEGLPIAGNIRLDYVLDGLEHDTVKHPHDQAASYIHEIDEVVSSKAASVIAEKAPDLSWVYLEYTDDMGHQFGDGARFYDAIKMADKQIDKIWRSIQLREQKFNEDWLIIVTTDHGRSAATGKNHGGQSDRERLTWITTNSRNLNPVFKNNPGIVDIVPSLLRHLSISIPDPVAREMDGVPFIGEVDLSDLNAHREGGNTVIQWKQGGSASLEIYDCETNLFKTGGTDQYRKVGTVAATEGRYTFPASTGFHKILVKGPHQYCNAWIASP